MNVTLSTVLIQFFLLIVKKKYFLSTIIILSVDLEMTDLTFKQLNVQNNFVYQQQSAPINTIPVHCVFHGSEMTCMGQVRDKLK